jgi:hypothetical protein
VELHPDVVVVGSGHDDGAAEPRITVAVRRQPSTYVKHPPSYVTWRAACPAALVQ